MKSTMHLSIILLALVLVTNGCKVKNNSTEPSTTTDLTEARKAIDSCNASFMELYGKGDSVGVANCYATDAKFMAANMPYITGHDKLVHIVSEFMKAGLAELKIETVDLWGEGDMLTEEETWSLSDKSGKVLDSGKGLLLWKQENGSWKIFRDCFNSDMPVKH